MGATTMLQKIVKVFSTATGKIAGPAKIGSLDSSVLKVAMLISALDGDVAESEMAAFEKLAAQCRGYSKESCEAVFDDGLRLAGYLMLQSKRFGEKRLIELFVEEAMKIMPDGFAVASGADVRRAFVMWTAMAMSDGEYSGVERKAINAFRVRLDETIDRVNRFAENKRSAYSPAFARAFVVSEEEFSFKSPTSDAFMKGVEKIIAKLDNPDTAAVAAKELQELIVNG